MFGPVISNTRYGPPTVIVVGTTGFFSSGCRACTMCNCAGASTIHGWSSPSYGNSGASISSPKRTFASARSRCASTSTFVVIAYAAAPTSALSARRMRSTSASATFTPSTRARRSRRSPTAAGACRCSGSTASVIGPAWPPMICSASAVARSTA